jgi:Transposase DDE domain
MPDTITQISDAMETVLDQVPEQNARTTGFIRRQRKLTAAVFVKTLVFGFLAKPDASIDELTGIAATLGVTVTPQALDERFTPPAAELLRLVLQASIQAMITADPVALAILDRFTEVDLLDSSTITLPEAFRAQYAGCGTTNPAAGNAAFKLSVVFDLKAGRLRGPVLEAGRVNDKVTALAGEVLPRGALRIADLGYFRLATLGQMTRDGVYFLSRFQAGTVVFDAQGRRWPRLSEWLRDRDARVDQEIRLGQRERLACRLLAARVPAAVAQQRIERLRAEAVKDGRNLSPECVALANWTVFVTNVPRRLLNVEEALALGRARWQIELLFKLWKSEGRIDEWTSTRPMYILCQIYAKLIGMVVQHWVVLVTSWEHVDRSLVKVSQRIRHYAWQLAAAVGDRTAVRRIITTLRRIFGKSCRINKRKKHPNTFQRLLNLGVEGLT